MRKQTNAHTPLYIPERISECMNIVMNIFIHITQPCIPTLVRFRTSFKHSRWPSTNGQGYSGTSVVYMIVYYWWNLFIHFCLLNFDYLKIPMHNIGKFYRNKFKQHFIQVEYDRMKCTLYDIDFVFQLI